MADPDSKADELRAAIAGLEAQRSLLGDAVVSAAIAALRQQLVQLNAPSTGVGAEERKIVTIVFVDVSGFTALSETLDPEEVRNVINACFDQLVPVVQKYGGTIDKFIGDEIMALFGAPVAHENDPERALRSALEMMDKISSFNDAHKTSLSLHIGVNTGPVVTGAVGSTDRKDYSVMGDAVNLAARLEDASPNGEIYVGPQTYRLTESLFHFDPLPPLALKGKALSLALYRLVGLRAAPKPARGIEGLRSKLVGRDRELQKIQAAVRSVRSGDGAIFAIVGEAGVGKSRLISEAFVSFAADLFHAEGRALSHTAGMSYWLARDLLRALLRCSEHTPVDELNEALRRSLRTLTPKTFEEVYPYLATLLQLSMEEAMQDRVKFLSTEALHGRILQAFEQYVWTRAKQEPLIVFSEDLHWSDPSSLLVIENLVPLVNEVPLLLILAYRPEEETTETFQRQAQAMAEQRFHLINLTPLTREQSGSLVEGLLQIENLPVAMRELILDRAEGNPFFIEEVLRSLLDSGAIQVQGGSITAMADVEQAHVPETVQGVVSARMDRLLPEHKAALQTAAVIGRNFQRKVLQHTVADDLRATLDDCLAELQRRDFVQAVPTGDSENGEYTFKHAITQDVAYQALLIAHRKAIHQRTGEALEALFSDRLAELSPTLAYHFEKAEAREKAFLYLRRAGEHAQAIFANTEAAAFYRSAIRQGESLLQVENESVTVHALAQIHESLGDVLRLGGKSDQARTSYDASLGLLPNDDRVNRSRLQRKTGSTYTLQRRYVPMTDAFDAAERELGDVQTESHTEWWNERMEILLERMHLFYWQGMSNEMMELAERHRTDIERNGTPVQRGRFFQMLGLAHLTRDRYVASEEAVRLGELAVSMSRGSTDPAEASQVRFRAGLIHLFRGNLKEAIEHCREALSLAERVGDLTLQDRCLTYLTVAYRRLGDQERTRSYAESSKELAIQLGMVEYVAMANANLAWLAWREERPGEARSLGEEALDLWHGMEDPYGVDWQAVLPLIAVAVAEQRLDNAVEHTRGLFRENQHPLPPILTEAAREVINVSEKNELANTKAAVERLIEVSRAVGYL